MLIMITSSVDMSIQATSPLLGVGRRGRLRRSG